MRKKKKLENKEILRNCISGMAGTIFLEFGTLSDLPGRHICSKTGCIWIRDRGAMYVRKSYFLFSVNMLTVWCTDFLGHTKCVLMPMSLSVCLLLLVITVHYPRTHKTYTPTDGPIFNRCAHASSLIML